MISTPTGRAVIAWLVLVAGLGLTITTLPDDNRRGHAVSAGYWLAGQLTRLVDSVIALTR